MTITSNTTIMSISTGTSNTIPCPPTASGRHHDQPHAPTSCRHIDVDVVDMTPMANYPRCPACGSWEVSRNTEFGRVWFSCRRCGLSF